MLCAEIFWFFYALSDNICWTLYSTSTLTLFCLIAVFSQVAAFQEEMSHSAAEVCAASRVQLHCRCCTETHFAALWPCIPEIWNTVEQYPLLIASFFHWSMQCTSKGLTWSSKCTRYDYWLKLCVVSDPEQFSVLAAIIKPSTDFFFPLKFHLLPLDTSVFTQVKHMTDWFHASSGKGIIQCLIENFEIFEVCNCFYQVALSPVQRVSQHFHLSLCFLRNGNCIFLLISGGILH